MIVDIQPLITALPWIIVFAFGFILGYVFATYQTIGAFLK